MALQRFWKENFKKVSRKWIDDGMGGGEWQLVESSSFKGLATLKSSTAQIVGAIRQQNELYSLSTMEVLKFNDFIKFNDIYLKV